MMKNDNVTILGGEPKYMSLNIPMTACDLDDVKFALQNVWSDVCGDAGGYNASEKAELVLDRVGGEAGKIVDGLISTYGYDKVERLVAQTLFGGK